jgi:hypothetical protein
MKRLYIEDGKTENKDSSKTEEMFFDAWSFCGRMVPVALIHLCTATEVREAR